MQCKEITDYGNCIYIMWQFYSALFVLFAKRNYAYTMNVNNLPIKFSLLLEFKKYSSIS